MLIKHPIPGRISTAIEGAGRLTRGVGDRDRDLAAGCLGELIFLVALSLCWFLRLSLDKPKFALAGRRPEVEEEEEEEEEFIRIQRIL